jgi:hypothetical protein
MNRVCSKSSRLKQTKISPNRSTVSSIDADGDFLRPLSSASSRNSLEAKNRARLPVERSASNNIAGKRTMNNVIELFQVRCDKLAKKPTCLIETLGLLNTKLERHNVDLTNVGVRRVIELFRKTIHEATSSLSRLYDRYLRLELKSPGPNDLDGRLQEVIDKLNDRNGHRTKVRLAFLRGVKREKIDQSDKQIALAFRAAIECLDFFFAHEYKVYEEMHSITKNWAKLLCKDIEGEKGG